MKINILLISLLLSVGIDSLAQQKSPVGVQLYSFRKQFANDVRGTFQQVKDMGITQVETAGFYGMSVEDFKKTLDEFGLKAVGTGASFQELSDETKLKEIIKNAKILGSKNIVCAWIDHQGTQFTINDINKAAEVFNKAGKLLAQNGLSFLYHAHGFEFRSYKDHYLMDELMTKTNPQYANFEMDIYWVSHPFQNPVTWLKKYPTRWKAMHIKDRRKGIERNENGNSDVENDVIVGTGDLYMADIIKQARKNGMKYFFIEDESSRSLTQVPESIAFLRPLFL